MEKRGLAPRKDSIKTQKSFSLTHLPNPKTWCIGKVNTQPDKQGWLYKRKQRNRKAWKKRWFILHFNALAYFDRQGSKDVRGIIPLEDAIIEEDSDSITGYRFSIGLFTIIGKDFFLRATSEDEILSWLVAINKSIAMYKTAEISNLKTTKQQRKLWLSNLRENFRVHSILQINGELESIPRIQIFGVALEEVLKNDGDRKIPFICEKVFHYIENKALEVMGIFRVSGDQEETNKLREAFELGENVDLFAVENVHSVAGLLKLFFRELPNPLATFELFSEYIAANLLPEPTRVKTIQEITDKLPITNWHLMKELFTVLSHITEFSDVNQMTSSNLAIVFAPTIFRQNNDDVLSSLTHTPLTIALSKTLIEHFNLIFRIENSNPRRSTIVSQKVLLPIKYLPDQKEIEEINSKEEKEKTNSNSSGIGMTTEELFELFRAQYQQNQESQNNNNNNNEIQVSDKKNEEIVDKQNENINSTNEVSCHNHKNDNNKTQNMGDKLNNNNANNENLNNLNNTKNLTRAVSNDNDDDDNIIYMKERSNSVATTPSSSSSSSKSIPKYKPPRPPKKVKKSSSSKKPNKSPRKSSIFEFKSTSPSVEESSNSAKSPRKSFNHESISPRSQQHDDHTSVSPRKNTIDVIPSPRKNTIDDSKSPRKSTFDFLKSPRRGTSSSPTVDKSEDSKARKLIDNIKSKTKYASSSTSTAPIISVSIDSAKVKQFTKSKSSSSSSSSKSKTSKTSKAHSSVTSSYVESHSSISNNSNHNTVNEKNNGFERDEGGEVNCIIINNNNNNNEDEKNDDNDDGNLSSFKVGKRISFSANCKEEDNEIVRSEIIFLNHSLSNANDDVTDIDFSDYEIPIKKKNSIPFEYPNHQPKSHNSEREVDGVDKSISDILSNVHREIIGFSNHRLTSSNNDNNQNTNEFLEYDEDEMLEECLEEDYDDDHSTDDSDYDLRESEILIDNDHQVFTDSDSQISDCLEMANFMLNEISGDHIPIAIPSQKISINSLVENVDSFLSLIQI